MKSIILVAHGSKFKEAGESLGMIVESLQKQMPDYETQYCYLSNMEPLFPETALKCIEDGAEEIVVIPYFILKGYHVLKDIPKMIEELSAAHPGVKIIYGDYLGYDELIVKLLVKRIEEARKSIDENPRK
jgi:sirohydrochlorin ferrochelatase